MKDVKPIILMHELLSKIEFELILGRNDIPFSLCIAANMGDDKLLHWLLRRVWTLMSLTIVGALLWYISFPSLILVNIFFSFF